MKSRLVVAKYSVRDLVASFVTFVVVVVGLGVATASPQIFAGDDPRFDQWTIMDKDAATTTVVPQHQQELARLKQQQAQIEEDHNSHQLVGGSVFASPKRPSKPNGLSCFACSSMDNPGCRRQLEQKPPTSSRLTSEQLQVSSVGGNTTTASSSQFSVQSRACLEDELFCSTVSIVRLEFVENAVMARFWALERNCTKGCNRGCMLIGERVRLRVCSQCCATPNCNHETGAAAPSAGSATSWPLLVIAAALAVLVGNWKMRFQHTQLAAAIN